MRFCGMACDLLWGDHGSDHNGMTQVHTSYVALTICVVAGVAMTGLSFAQAPAPRAPVAVNVPGAPGEVPSAKASSGGPQPISPATPRVGPAPTGQVVAYDY